VELAVGAELAGVELAGGVEAGAVVAVAGGVDEEPELLFGRNTQTSTAVTTTIVTAHMMAWRSSRRLRGGL
jgi:hypothetical protein